MNVNANTVSSIYSLSDDTLKYILKDTKTSSLFVCKAFYRNLDGFFTSVVEKSRQSYLKNKIEKIIYQKQGASAQEVVQALYEKMIRSYASKPHLKPEREIIETVFKGKFISFEAKRKTIEEMIEEMTIPWMATGKSPLEIGREIIETVSKVKPISFEAKRKTIEETTKEKTIREIFTGHFSSFEQFEEVEKQLEEYSLINLGRALPEVENYYIKELKGKSLTEQATAIREWLNSNADKVGAASELFLTGNHLYKLPKEISLFVNLERLKIGYNKLQTLPVEIGQLKKLSQIEAMNNKLQSLPAEIGNLEQIKELLFYKNNLIDLPIQIGQLKKLAWLDISANPLIKLPKEISNLTNLSHLIVDSLQTQFLSDDTVLLENKDLVEIGEASSYESAETRKKYQQKYLRIANTAFPNQKRSLDEKEKLMIMEKETVDVLMTDVMQ